MGLSARETAKQLGLTHPALLKAAKSGRITRAKDGGFDVDQVRRQLAQNSNALKRRKPTRQTAGTGVSVQGEGDSENPSSTLAEAQRQREWLKVQKDELDLARKQAELAPIREINAWVAGMIIRAREILVRIGPELKDRLAQQANPHECERLVTSEVHRALNELAEFRPQN